MKCRTTRHWLLLTPAGEALPKAVRRHVSECARCRRRYRRLLRLEKRFKVEPAPVCAASMQAFLNRMPELPAQTPAPASAPPAKPTISQPVLYWAASILFLVGLIGWLLYFADRPETPAPELVRTVAPASADDQLVTRFVQRDLVLADTTVPSKQWLVLTEMADDLRAEAIRLIDKKAPDDLPLVTSLYERVLQRGLVGRAGALPAKERKDLLQSLAKHLRGQSVELEHTLRQAPPDWTTLLQPIQNASRQTADVFDQDAALKDPRPGEPVAMPGGSDYRRLLLSALVMNGLRLAEETDPLKRADCCSDLADNLLQAIVTASVQGDRQNVSALSKHLGEFVERGVSANLARVPIDDPRVTELRQVMLRANQILLNLDKTIEQMTAQGQVSKIGPASLDQLKDLEKMLKDVEKSLKKVHKAFKEPDKVKETKEKEKTDRDKEPKGKGKGKSVSAHGVWPAAPVRPGLVASAKLHANSGDCLSWTARRLWAIG